MIPRFFVRLSGCGLALGCASFALQGCGGGSASTGTTTRAALTGTVTAPQSQTRGAKSTRDTDPLIPVQGASVSLVNLDDPTTTGGSVVGTTTTGANGSYSFPTVVPGTNYKIEATKAIGGRTLKLDAIVTAPAADTGSGSVPSAPVAHDLTPTSTVAAVTTLQQIAVLKSVDPTAKNSNLQAIADDLAKKRDDAHLPPPDLTDPNAVAAAVTTLKQSAAPQGSYAGTAVTTAAAAGSTGDTVGETNRLAAQIDVAGKFFLIAMPGDKTSTTATGSNGNGGSTGSNGNDTGTSSGKDNSDFAIGTVTADGIVNATTKNGKVRITGLFTGGIGVGTWSQTDGSASGTWSLTLLTKTYSGLYAGKHYTDVQSTNQGSNSGNGANSTSGGNGGNGANGSGSNGGNGNGDTGGSSSGGSNGGSGNGNGGSNDFALVVLDDGTCYIMGSNGSGNQPIIGTGTVSSAGVLAFQIKNQDGTVVTGTGQIDTAHKVTGTYSDTSGEQGHFAGRSNHADTSDL